MRKILLMSMLITMILVADVVFANDAGIECTSTVTEDQVYITGKVPNVTQAHLVGLLVGNIDNILYVGQTTCDSNGKFSFYFELPDSLAPGVYDVAVGTSANAETYNGTLVYAPTVERQFFNADITVTLSSYVPTITGTMRCIEGKTISFTAVDKSDNTVVAQDTVTVEDGEHNLSYTLPSIATGRDYTATISCQDVDATLFSINVEINSSIILVSVGGNVQVADNVRLDARAKTSNSDLIDKSTTFTSGREVSVTIPNLVANVSCDVSMQGYERVPKRTVLDLFTKFEKFKIEWLYTATVNRFYSAGGNLYSLNNDSEIKISDDIEAKFIVSYGDYLYYSDMRKNGKIYRCNKDGSNVTLVSEDSASWLYIKDGCLYYKDNGNNREEKCVNISVE